ncbi:unnamed protein product [marine sediment metagenome]|uniref:Uncharacterized protein n=1 Tax=marine sediment metagenome TaxID=412755 RepID=X1SSC6_9ZZZZ
MKETDDLHQMVQNWKESWLTHYSTDGVNEWIYEEFVEEIEIYIIPYIGRLYDINHLTETDCGVFCGRLFGEITDMRRLLGLQDPEDSPLESS